MIEYVNGSQLKIGDTIEVWWFPNRDTIIALRPYCGPLEKYFTGGAQLAEFALLKTGMTIDNNETYERLCA